MPRLARTSPHRKTQGPKLFRKAMGVTLAPFVGIAVHVFSGDCHAQGEGQCRLHGSRGQPGCHVGAFGVNPPPQGWGPSLGCPADFCASLCVGTEVCPICAQLACWKALSSRRTRRLNHCFRLVQLDCVGCESALPLHITGLSCSWP